MKLTAGWVVCSLNVSTKSFALVGAALLLLDYASTSVVSAATAASYLAGEVPLPFPTFVGVIIILAIFTLISLSGIRESARLALIVLSFHVSLWLLFYFISIQQMLQMVTMVVLIICSSVHWRNIGIDQLKENWNVGQAPSASAIALQIFYGFCLGMLGVTGFECMVSHFI